MYQLGFSHHQQKQTIVNKSIVPYHPASWLHALEMFFPKCFCFALHIFRKNIFNRQFGWQFGWQFNWQFDWPFGATQLPTCCPIILTDYGKGPFYRGFAHVFMMASCKNTWFVFCESCVLFPLYP